MAKLSELLAIDTDALSYLLGDGDESLKRRIKAHLNTAKDKGIPLIMPTVVLSEYLCQYDQNSRERIVDGLENEFIIVDFDVKAAIELAAIRKPNDGQNVHKRPPELTAAQFKFDQMIAATSLAAGATHILTGNTRDFANLTDGRLKVIDIRNLPPVQQSLVEDVD